MRRVTHVRAGVTTANLRCREVAEVDALAGVALKQDVALGAARAGGVEITVLRWPRLATARVRPGYPADFEIFALRAPAGSRAWLT